MARKIKAGPRSVQLTIMVYLLIVLVAGVVALTLDYHHLIAFPPTWIVLTAGYGLGGAECFCDGRSGHTMMKRWLAGFAGGIAVGVAAFAFLYSGSAYQREAEAAEAEAHPERLTPEQFSKIYPPLTVQEKRD
ncbi:hypothetical protein [Erwinia amylovora]